ncbi:hypothetical protein TNCV_103341 [Trichonephila clavipes]|nr:hypothetical protein TNCV_103341 [Trichonephila clavipes]
MASTRLAVEHSLCRDRSGQDAAVLRLKDDVSEDTSQPLALRNVTRWFFSLLKKQIKSVASSAHTIIAQLIRALGCPPQRINWRRERVKSTEAPAEEQSSCAEWDTSLEVLLVTRTRFKVLSPKTLVQAVGSRRQYTLN